MKRANTVTLGMLLLLIFIGVFASGTPRLINYQGKLTSDSGVALNGNYDITFRIYDVETGGTPLWEEIHSGASAITVTNGLFDVQLGTITPLTIAFDDTYWIELEVSGETLSPRERLVAVPYAFRALWADSVEGISYVSYIDSVQYIDSITYIDSVTYITTIRVVEVINRIDSVRYIDSVNYADSISFIDSVNFADSISFIDYIDYIDSVGYIDSIGWVGHTNWADSAQWAGYVHWDSIDGIPADISDGDNIDTMVAHWDSLRNIPAGFADGTDDVNDADANPSNELITSFTWNDASDQLTITEAGTPWTVIIDNEADDVTLADVQAACSNDFHNIGGVDSVDDADADPNNEMQTIVAGNGLTGGGSGSSITIDVGAIDGTIYVGADGIRQGLGAPKATSTSYKLYRNY